MNIVVIIKQVPDTEASVRGDATGKSIVESDIKFVVNPYDEYAVEEAVRIKEKSGAAAVTVLTVGPPRAEEALRTCLAMGADEAARIERGPEGSIDQLGTAKLLAKVIRGMPYDIILCGKQAIDDDMAGLGALLAEELGLPHVSVVTRLELSGTGAALCRKEIDGGYQTVETALPAVFSAQKGLNEPRYPALRGLMLAKKKEIKVHDASSLGIPAGELEPLFLTLKLHPPKTRGKGVVLQGEAETTAVELVRLLAEEAKVI